MKVYRHIRYFWTLSVLVLFYLFFNFSKKDFKSYATRRQQIRKIQSNILVYEGGHRVPLLMWWPHGIHQSLHGTNFDLPISHADFFATFAEILDYPLPKGDSCVYSFNSRTAAAHGQDAAKIGRPSSFESNPNRWLADVQNGREEAEFDGSIIIRSRSGKPMYHKEYTGVGPDRTEQWLTKEDLTGRVENYLRFKTYTKTLYKKRFFVYLLETKYFWLNFNLKICRSFGQNIEF